MDTLQLKLSNGTKIVVPASLASVTTNVLLEQESWFEKEIDFIRHYLRPGMTVVDIGANMGVYSLPMAYAVGPIGQVFAYEPGTEARELLARSRDINALRNLNICPLALSAEQGRGYLRFGNSSEGNALGEVISGAGESVAITTLDAEDRARGWPPPDFVKIDAEGQEEQIVGGASEFFTKYSPLIMFEIEAGKPNARLLSLFRAKGYRIFRSLVDIPILVPVDHQELDKWEINLFAAKPDRAAAMSREGLLVEHIEIWQPDESQIREGWKCLLRSKFVPAFPICFSDLVSVETEYRKVLAAFAYCSSGNSAQMQCSALAYAYRSIVELCDHNPSAARLSTLARVAWHWGSRSICIEAGHKLFRLIEKAPLQLVEPFLPASPRFDGSVPANSAALWFMVAAAEQFERAAHLAGCFSTDAAVLRWLWERPFVSADMQRRALLMAWRNGEAPKIPKSLEMGSDDNLNPEVWRLGSIARIVEAVSAGS